MMPNSSPVTWAHRELAEWVARIKLAFDKFHGGGRSLRPELKGMLILILETFCWGEGCQTLGDGDEVGPSAGIGSLTSHSHQPPPSPSSQPTHPGDVGLGQGLSGGKFPYIVQS